MKFQLRYKKYILIVGILLLLSSVFFLAKNTKSNKAEYIEKKPPFVLIYDRMDQKLVKYYPLLSEYQLFDEEENTFQYEFPNPESSILTSGNSVHNNFSIIKKNQSSVMELVTIPGNESLIPLDIYQKKYYFIHYFYNDNGEELPRKISVWEEESGKLNTIDYEFDKIINGIIIEDVLYYTYFDESQNIFNLSSFDLETLSNKKDIKKHLSDDTLFKANNQIWYVNEDGLLENIVDSKIKKIPLGYKNYIRGNNFITIQDVEKNGVFIPDIKIYDFESEELINQNQGSIDFNMENNTINFLP